MMMVPLPAGAKIFVQWRITRNINYVIIFI